MLKPVLMLLRLRPGFVAKVMDIAALEALYGTSAKPSIIKVVDHLTPLYAKWIARVAVKCSFDGWPCWHRW